MPLVRDYEAELKTRDRELERLRAENEALEKAKNVAYGERNRMVLLASALLPAWLERHPESDAEWEDDWRWIVFIELPTGQASWHIHDKQLRYFDHLERRSGNSWDGHTPEEKYRRVEAFACEPKREPDARGEVVDPSDDPLNWRDC